MVHEVHHLYRAFCLSPVDNLPEVAPLNVSDNEDDNAEEAGGGSADTTKYAVLGFTKINLSNHLLLKHDLWKTENQDVTHVPSCYSDTNLIDFIHQTRKSTMLFCRLSPPPIYTYIHILQKYVHISILFFIVCIYAY